MSKLIEDIYTSSLSLLVPSSPQDLYKSIVDEARKLIKAERGSLFFVSNNSLVRVYSNVPSKFQATPRKNGYIYQTYVTGQPKIVYQEEMLRNHPNIDKSINTFIAIPLFH